MCWSVIYLCEAVAQGVRYFWSTLCTRTWYQSFYEESLSVLIKIWNRVAETFKGFLVLDFLCIFGLWELFHCVQSAISIVNRFCFTENRFCFLQKHPFRQIWRYNVTVTDSFFLNLSYFISLLVYILCFSLRLLFSLTAYALFRAPCAIAANQKQ